MIVFEGCKPETKHTLYGNNTNVKYKSPPSLGGGGQKALAVRCENDVTRCYNARIVL